MKNKNGFTLLELFITIVILSILSTSAIMSFKTYIKQKKVENDTFIIYGLLKNYNLKSIKEEKVYFAKIKSKSISFYKDLNNNNKLDDNDIMEKEYKLSNENSITCSSKRVLNYGIKFNYKAIGFGYYACSIIIQNSINSNLYKITFPVNNTRIRLVSP